MCVCMFISSAMVSVETPSKKVCALNGWVVVQAVILSCAMDTY